MRKNIEVKEGSIDVAVKVSATIVEFDQPYSKDYFEDRYRGKVKLILVAYIDKQAVGYMVAYDKNRDDSFYCWMAGVNPSFRRLGALSKMMEYLEDWAKSHSYKKITIKTRNNRREMLTYLVGAGFHFTEVQPHSSIEDNRILLEKLIT